MIRSTELEELLRHPPAFALLGLVAYRARWKRDDSNSDRLEVGEAFIGDFKEAGLKTRGQYRNALQLLNQRGLVTTKRTNRGTIAKLISGSVFDIRPPDKKRPKSRQNNNHQSAILQPSLQPSEQPSAFIGKKRSKQPSAQPSDNHQSAILQPLTNKEQRNNVDDVARAPDPQLRARCAHIAATATDASLLEELQKLFPQHNLTHEVAKYSKWHSDNGRTSSREGFVSWMLRARPPFKPRRRAQATQRPSSVDNYVPRPLSEEEQADADRIKRELEKRKLSRENGLRDPAAS